MLSVSTVRRLLAPFSIELSDRQVEQLLTYNALLLRWNEKINLTTIDNPEESVVRQFAESFYLSTIVELSGRLLDVGSGAGFPGMALKLLRPNLGVCLLEPTAKKRAFLKEVARTCELGSVEVIGETLKQFIPEARQKPADFTTIRAVGNLKQLVPQAVKSLKVGGHLCLWVGSDQIPEILDLGEQFLWNVPTRVPLSSKRYLLVGRLNLDSRAQVRYVV